MATISSRQAAFLKFEIENGDGRRRKVALQELSRQYRLGNQLNAETRNALEKLINGIVLNDSDKKVVRWCLNALARFGNRQNCSKYVQIALTQYVEDPEIVAAGVAALSRMYDGNLDLVPELNSLDPAIRILAAMQTTEVGKLDVSKLSIDIDKADVEVLKLALLTVGLNRDIQNLLHPRHENGTIVKQLCQHDDPIVKQYSVWSVMENKRLTLKDLGICFSRINDEPVNVQAKLLQLAAEREPDLIRRHEIIYDGSYNAFPDARMGLAVGVRNAYFTGLEDITLNWYDGEANSEIRELIAEHFSKFSDDCPPYFERSLVIAESEPKLLDRLLLGAEGKDLYSRLRANSAKNGILDLFGNSSNLESMFQHSAAVLGRPETMKMLFLAANPIDQGNLRLDEEARDLKTQLGQVRGKSIEIDVEHAWATRVDQIQSEILNAKPDILHFSGHGDTGVLIFEDADGNTHSVEGEALAELVSLVPSIKCVVLNACYSESVATLIAPHVEAVIGCDISISDDAAIQFTRSFYRALAHRQTFSKAFRLAKNEVSLNGAPNEASKYKIII